MVTRRLYLSGITAAVALMNMIAQPLFAQPRPTDRVMIEHVTTKPGAPQDGLATKEYEPTEDEESFYDELAEKERITGTETEDYDITKREEKYVSWFGIVRKIEEDKTERETVLTIEHKYFDGLTDTHIMAVSFNGSGDFQAILPGTGLRIEPLSLVRIYGFVLDDKNAKLPQIAAVFVRDWHWETFTFIADYGTQRGSESWRKLNQVDLDDIYDPAPDVSYYRFRLGDRLEDVAHDKEFRKDLLDIALEIEPDAKDRWTAFIDAFCSRDGEKLDENLDKIYKAHGFETLAVVLADGLAAEDAAIRFRAADILTELGDRGVIAIQALTWALEDRNESVRAQAVRALGAIGQRANSAVPKLLELLKDPDDLVRMRAIEALAEIGAPAKQVVPALLETLKDSDDQVRYLAAGLLGKLGRDATAALEPLISLLRDDPDENVRGEAAWALGHVDAEGLASVPVLIETLDSLNRQVRAAAARGLAAEGIQARSALPALESLLKDSDPGVRTSAAEAVWRLGGDIQKVVPVLNGVLAEGGELDPLWAAEVVADIGPQARDAVPGLTKALQNSDASVRQGAAWALGRIGPAAADAVPDLEKRLEDRNSSVRALAAEALWQINQHPKAIPQLLKELQDESAEAEQAAVAVGRIGAAAAEAIPRLKELINSPDRWTRREAAAALKKLESSAKK